MRLSIKPLLVGLGLLAFAFAGCGDDDNNSTGPTGGGTGINLSSAIIPIPTAMANAAGSNAGAAYAQGYLQLLNSFANFSTYLVPPSAAAAKIAANDVHTWTDGGLTITLTIQDTGSEIAWEVMVNGSNGEVTYENFLLLDGYREKTVNSGMLNLYEPTKQNSPSVYWTWSTDPEGMFSSSYFDLGSNTWVNGTVNVNGSGSVSYSVDNVLSFGASWATDGSGSYVIYNEGGSPVDSGTWPA